MEVKPYVMTWQGGTNPSDVDLETRIAIYGPFKTEEEAKDWGKSWQDDNEDNPCWQLVILSKDDMKLDRDGSYLAVSVIAAT